MEDDEKEEGAQVRNEAQVHKSRPPFITPYNADSLSLISIATGESQFIHKFRLEQ